MVIREGKEHQRHDPTPIQTIPGILPFAIPNSVEREMVYPKPNLSPQSKTPRDSNASVVPFQREAGYRSRGARQTV